MVRRTSPTRVPDVSNLTGNRWTAIAGGELHSLGVRDDGTLWAWGTGYFGGLGLGDTANRMSPTEVFNLWP